MFFRKNTILWLLASCLSVSCSELVYFPIEVKATSQVPLDKVHYTKVLVVDNTPLQTQIPIRSYLPNGDTDVGVLSFDSLGILFKDKFAEALSQRKLGDEVVAKPEALGARKSEIDSSALPLDAVRQLAAANGADILLSVDFMKTNAVFWSDYRNYGQYVDSLVTNISIQINAYRPDGKLIVPTIRYNNYFPWGRTVAETKRTDFLTSEKFTEVLGLATGQIAAWAADIFVPGWEPQRRWYYLIPNSADSKRAAALAAAHRWEEAAVLWEAMYQKTANPVQRARLASNLALANELTDDLESALEWLKKAETELNSLSKFDKDRLQNYHQDIVIRMEDEKKLGRP